jgi:predicted dehydrogenase
MKLLFIGLGSIGKRHARLIKQNYDHELFALRTGNVELGVNGITELYRWEEVFNLNPDVAFITNPTFLHIETAIKCAERGMKIFLEKPLGNSLEGLDELVKIVTFNKTPSMVAYNLRFHPIIQEIKKYMAENSFLHMRIKCTSYLPNWRPTQNYTEGYSVRSDMGGGVILDLSHEIDYANYLLGNIISIEGDFSKRSSLTRDTEDYADLLLDTEKGPAIIHINFLSHQRQRIIEVDFDEMSIHADLNSGIIVEYCKERIVKEIKFDYEIDDTYLKQLKYFFANINNPFMMNNIVEASNLFKKIIKFREHF